MYFINKKKYSINLWLIIRFQVWDVDKKMWLKRNFLSKGSQSKFSKGLIINKIDEYFIPIT